MAKARVTPIKKVTTPRLELTAACVAVRLSRILQKELQYKLTDIYYWTDSMSVIRYVNNETSRFKTFVANRITIIRDGSDPRQWKHIPTALNPADAASRGMRMATFLKMDQWFKGPTFLWESEEEWPSVVKACDNIPEDDPEMKSVVAATVTDESVDIMNRLLNYSSSWLKLKKIVGWFLLFMDYLKRKLKEKQESAKRTQECAEHLAKSKKTKVTVQEEKSRGHLTVKIMEKAEVTILCYIQQQYFHDIISALKNPSKESRLNKSIRKLDPFLEDGLLRVGGRLSQASLPYEVKHPIILPKKCFVSQLIVQDSHESMGHMGKAAMMTYLRQRYWIQGVGHLIKKITSTCVICRRCSAQRKKQKMADLPVDRLTAGEPPFSRVGVDFFGPFVVKRGRSNVKRYGVVFTCLALRAVHLELAASLDTSSCVNAFRRFFARRGHPKKVWTDNGTNLVGCEREMREDIHLWNIEQLHQTFLQRNISWEFNPPSASHHGGVWERMIRTIRRILYSLLHSQVIHLDDDGLQTLFCEVEVIVNSRPITTVTNDVKDLTPYH
ncbi:uncharacterized protein LOC125374660 [Haliotis rufescens]|uniref:uncharacterized protein LOC125374660 n=1 Tax=Haliotis rufescens TaxID=6454 RepID=UPI00201E797E|nr:uncharacterized protein LOC125374660 [Haliotis rufescens]